MADPIGHTQGLTTSEARSRLASHGLNEVAGNDEDGLLEELLESLKEPLVLLLLGIGGLYLVFGELRDAVIIFGVIITVAVTEATIEWRAGRAVAALSAMSEPNALVWRNGMLGEYPTREIVPGDLLELRAGSRVPADARLIDSSEFAADDSLVTGESQAVEHDALDAASAELHAGTAVVRGRGRAVALRTGKDSTLGRIAEPEEPQVVPTPEALTPRRMTALDLPPDEPSLPRRSHRFRGDVCAAMRRERAFFAWAARMREEAARDAIA